MRPRNLIFGLLAAAIISRARAEQSRAEQKVHRIAIVNPMLPVAVFTNSTRKLPDRTKHFQPVPSAMLRSLRC
jgi:hypothetical protein